MRHIGFLFYVMMNFTLEFACYNWQTFATAWRNHANYHTSSPKRRDWPRMQDKFQRKTMVNMFFEELVLILLIESYWRNC